MIKKLLILVIGLVFSQPFAFAQDAPPALMVTGSTGVTPLRVSAVRIEAKIHGFLAETHMTMTFHNSSSRALSGDLYFPLPEGSTVSGYALDIEGSMVDGVAVEKTRARTVFEKIVRQGIDPGLVEWVKGGNFKTRVFPIPANGERTVRVSYSSSLKGEDATPTYSIPLKFTERIDDFSIRVEVVSPPGPPVFSPNSLPGLVFARWRESFVAETSAQNVVLNKDITIELPERNDSNLLVERSADGITYFALRASPPAPTRFAATVPRRIAVYWDGSQSRKSAEHSRELDILGRYLRRMVGNTLTVDVVVFRDRAENVKTFEVEDADGREIISYLQNVIYDGGTQLGSVAPLDTPVDYNLLFTDGMSNFGAPKPENLTKPLYIISSSSISNHGLLRSLAAGSGGAYFNLANTTPGTVVESIGKPVFSFLRARICLGSA